MRIILSLAMAVLFIIGAGCAPEATHRPISDDPVEINNELKQPLQPEVEAAAAAVEEAPVEPSQVQFIEPQKQPAPVQRVYIIRKGDTLWSIAEDYYGNGQKWREILNANPGLEPTRMRVGQQLILP